MPGARRSTPNQNQTRRPPARSPDQRENQLIDLAVDLAETQLRDGTASAQVISHYLKLGSSREALEQERLRHENTLLITKNELMESEKRTEALVEEALRAMQSYTGAASSTDERNGDDYEG